MPSDQPCGAGRGALPARTSKCLSDSDLAALMDPVGGEAGRSLDHVAGCDFCGARLRLLMEMQANDPSAEDLEMMQALRSSTPEWQRRTVQMLHNVATETLWTRLARLFEDTWLRPPRWAMAAAAVLIAASSAGWWIYSQNPSRKCDRLLAEAYTANRQFEWRLPDAGRAQLQSQRGTVRERASSLLEAEALIAREASGRETDPRWLGFRARAEILDLEPDSAVALLQEATRVEPNSADLCTDLAIAYGLDADRKGQPAEFAAVVEFTTRALAVDPKHRRALFNRAIAFERLHMVDRAIEDWKQYLNIETDPAWIKEARERLERLSAIQRERGRKMNSDEPSDALLELKAVKWLKDDRPRARGAAGALLASYGDRWLVDAATEPVNSEPLWRTVNSYAAGEVDDALQYSRAAIRLYTQQSAPAHLARAELESINALDRSMRPADCLAQAADLARTAEARSYRWIQAQAIIQTSTCSDMMGSFSASIEIMRKAIELARRFRMTGLESRAVGIEVSRRTTAGDLWVAWRENRDLLERLADSPYSPIRLQQGLTNYSFSAELWGWRAASFEFGRAAADALRDTPNRINEAVNRNRAAALALEAHLHPEYAAELQKARKLFAGLPESETRSRYLNSVRLLEGQSYLLSGRLADAARVLRPVAASAVLQREQWRAHQYLGLSLLPMAGRDAALPELQAAVDLLNRRFATLPRVSQRSRARREGLEAYRTLTDVLLDDDESGARSLRVWLAASGSNAAPDLVFLPLKNGYAVWTNQGRRLQRLVLDRGRVRQSISRMLTAAADPQHPVADVKREGRALFDLLLAPTLGAIPSGAVLTVLPDAEIAAIPFQLMVDPEGHWLGDYCAVVFSGHPRRSGVHWSPPKHALAIGSPATEEALPPLPESRAEAEEVASRFTGSTILTGSEATLGAVTNGLERADLWHFSGHGYAGATVGGLYLADSLLTSVSLQDLSLGACRLAILSACLTAAGQSEGLMNPDSLVHALLDAGAQSVIASRWSVDSAATARLMSGFYSDLNSTGDPAQSLRRASGLVRAEPKYAHPYYWGAFQTYE